MFGAFKQRGWSGVVGLITAYAFVLQAFFAYSVASQAAVHGNSSGAFFVICTNDGTGTGTDGATVPVQPTTHCPLCILTPSSSPILPHTVELPTLWPMSVHWTPFISACLSFHRARAGLSRAPPLHV